MTKSEILALPLDKLNELVAEKVMEDYHTWRGDSRLWPRLFDYSGHIEAAWRVQEKMAEKGYKITIALLSDASWACHFMHGEELQVVPVARSQPSAPEAICRAALLAVSE